MFPILLSFNSIPSNISQRSQSLPHPFSLSLSLSVSPSSLSHSYILIWPIQSFRISIILDIHTKQNNPILIIEHQFQCGKFLVCYISSYIILKIYYWLIWRRCDHYNTAIVTATTTITTATIYTTAFIYCARKF